jgi:peptidoglycan/LPS O-acetylase OafA/YrhL
MPAFPVTFVRRLRRLGLALVAALLAGIVLPATAFADDNYPATIPSGTKTGVLPQVLPTKVAQSGEAVLAYTGANTWPLVGLAVLLIVVGLVAFRIGRKPLGKH